MPTSLTIRLKGDEEHKHGPYMAPLMQGFLMEKIDTAYAQVLHESGAHPYSQYVLVKDDDILWTVNALSTEAEQQIIKPLLNLDEKTIHLTRREETLQVYEKVAKSWNYTELIEKYYFGSCSRNLTIRFQTPTSFKQNGRYCLFPNSRLVFQSLMLRYDAGSEDSRIFSDELVEEFEEYAEITDYRLRSVRYSLEGVKIPSFIGECTFRIKGPQQMVNTAHMLAHFGEYSGVGIKTGLGMGAMEVIEYSGFRKKP